MGGQWSQPTWISWWRSERKSLSDEGHVNVGGVESVTF